MRVLHLISSSGLYGAEKMVVNLCRRLDEQGATTRLQVFENARSVNLEVADFGRAAGLDVQLLPCAGRFDPRAVLTLRASLRSFGADVIHTHGYKAHLYGFLAARNTGIKMVATCHRFDNGPNNRFDGRIFRRCDRVIGVSEEATESVRTEYGVTRAVTIGNGVHVADFRDAEPTLDGGPLIGVVARLAPEKGVGDLLIAAQGLAARVVVVGDGPLRAELTDQDRALGTDARFLGFREDIPGIYASLTVLVQPSYREGMPMTLLEAMAAGLPVIASDVGAAAEVIEDGRSGFIFEPGDTARLRELLHRVLGDAELRARVGAAARARISKSYTDEAMAAAYLREYRTL